MIICIDFDGTLSQPSIQNLAKWLTSETNHEVFILSSRMNKLLAKQFPNMPDNAKVFEVAKLCNIPPENVIFTNQESKRTVIIRSGANILIDNDKYELQNCEYVCKTFNANYNGITEVIKEYITH